MHQLFNTLLFKMISCVSVLSNLSSLVEVNVSVGDCCIEEQVGTIKHANQARSLVKEITGVKVLSLGYNTMAVCCSSSLFYFFSSSMFSFVCLFYLFFLNEGS